MIEQSGVQITLPADVAQVDGTGHVWAFLDRAAEPGRVVPGMLIVAGDADEPFLARVVEIVDGPGRRQIVHIDVVGVPEQAIEELRHAHLLADYTLIYWRTRGTTGPLITQRGEC